MPAFCFALLGQHCFQYLPTQIKQSCQALAIWHSVCDDHQLKCFTPLLPSLLEH